MTVDFKRLRDPFPESHIEWRIAQSGKNGQKIWAKCVAYIQARAVMDRLDEVCGPGNWQLAYRPVDGPKIEPGILCAIAIRVGDEWVSKEDGSDQTDIEKFKGGISGAIKRAAVAWGIGRYLYDLEEGWAQIVTQDTPGGNWAQTKAKDTFYWLPPKLPAWALPAGSQAKPAAVVVPPKPVVVTPPVVPPFDNEPLPGQKPPPDVGNPPVKNPKDPWKANPAQTKRLWAIIGAAHKTYRWKDDEQIRGFMKQTLKLDSTKELSHAQYDWLCSVVELMTFEEAFAQWSASEHERQVGK